MLKFSDKDFRTNFTEIPQQATMDTWEKNANFSIEKPARKKMPNYILELKTAVTKMRKKNILNKLNNNSDDKRASKIKYRSIEIVQSAQYRRIHFCRMNRVEEPIKQ